MAVAMALLTSMRAPGQTLKITDERRLVSMASVQMSPDGKQVAFIKSTPDFKTDTRITTLVLVDVATGAARAMTDGKQNISSLHWSPTADRLAFLSEGTGKQDQIFVLPRNGGKPVEITHAKNGVQQFSWSPDGRRFAFVTPDDDPNEEAIKRHDDLFTIGNDGYLISHVAVPSHLWLVDSNGMHPRRLTRGAWSVLETGAPFVGGPSDPSWSHDGTQIAFAQQATPHASDSDQTQIAVVDVRTGKVRPVTTDARYEYQPQFSSASDDIAYLRPHGPTPLSVMDVFATTPGRNDRSLTPDFDHNITAFAYVPGSGDIVLQGNEGIHTTLWLRSANGRTQALNLGGLTADDFSPAKTGAVAFVGSRIGTPQELYVATAGGALPKRLTRLNASLARFRPTRVEEFTWSAPDGEKNDGVLLYPAQFAAGNRYPLLVWNHGGPEAASVDRYANGDAEFLMQTLAAEGYFVFMPNYRGSDNLGNRHEHAIYKDPGSGPMADVISGIDALVNKGFIDEARISIGGHSYGGFMTAWLMGHDHRWRSAVVADGALDWRDTYNFTEVGNMAWARDSLGGTPTDPESADLYRTGSPITYATEMNTPTLIFSGTSDQVVPITQSFALYHALRDRHIPTRFYGAPGSGHSLHDPVRIERYNQLIRDWIVQHNR